MTGGGANDRGTPQGGVVSPLLANLSMNRMLKGWRQAGRAEQMEWTRGVLGRLKLTLNEKKTSIRFSGLCIRAALQRADWPGVFGAKPVEEERERDEAKCGRAPVARQQRTVGGSAGPAESEAGRLENILRTGEHGAGVSGGRRIRGRAGAAFPGTAAQGVYARHSPVFDETGVRTLGSLPASGAVGCRCFVSLR